ncbi:MAG TPA: helix-turn-helix domain-containing protein [Kofleriaceae bacterium]|jgi:AcrR family transcriptional regulator|nr:helix-turn-helix domain-containing protein [Kofleriaceae bacterium]
MKSPRERLLDAANELFYKEGIQTVGIDRVIDRAGVAKASLYSAFGSKDELARAYLARRHELRQIRIAEMLATRDTPRAKILGIYDIVAELAANPSFRGCAFVNARAEAPKGSAVVRACDEMRAWTHSLFISLTREAAAADPVALAADLVLLYDGAMATARMDDDPEAPIRAKAIAARLIDAAISTPAS